ncbi:hypothetical protein L596_016734 [Steinernema carpocapsae]|uniref:Uncharacterized protein n=1 Tax=Steinernema carpocapsae TaxID=34508 RepID=A0A4V6A3I5_STECR|nr:hypothetical protein L596_016734 [Steinernema carpocapsae]
MNDLKRESVLECAALLYAAPYSYYLKNKDKYLTIVWHHDLIDNSKKTILDLFHKLQIPSECVPAALKCLDYDSQDGTFISRKVMSKIKATEPSDEEINRLKLYSKHMDIPEWILLGQQQSN